MRGRRINTSSMALLTLAVAACDAKAGSEYEGEPLLTLRGSVSIAGGEQSPDVVPALAFVNNQRATVDIVDVQVTGEFPAAFRLDVLVPPPPSALLTDPKQSEPLAVDSPPFAIGYITAVPREHERAFPLVSETVQTRWCEPAEDFGRPYTEKEIEAAWAGEIPARCYEYFRASSQNYQTTIYTRLKSCDDQWQSCSVEETGDARGTIDPYEYFEGVSENYTLLYLAEPAPVGSAIAHHFAEGQALAAGYHLFESRELTAEERDESAVCEGYATLRALEDFNAAHGTSYMNSVELREAVLHEPLPKECAPGVWQSPLDSEQLCNPRLTDVGLELLKSETRAKIALGCPILDQHFERVEQPEQAEIAVRIGRLAEPIQRP